MGADALGILRDADLPGLKATAFLDEDAQRMGGLYEGLPVQGLDETLAGLSPDAARFVITIDAPRTRAKLREKLEAGGFELATLVHPKAHLERGVELGPGCVVSAGAVIARGSHLAGNSMVNHNAVIGHDGSIGRDSMIAPGAHLGGWVRIGEACYVGTGANVLPRVSVGDRSVVGIGCALLEDLPADTTARPPEPTLRAHTKRS